MAPQSLEELGFKEGEGKYSRPKQEAKPKLTREQTGFIAGVYLKQPHQAEAKEHLKQKKEE